MLKELWISLPVMFKGDEQDDRLLVAPATSAPALAAVSRGMTVPAWPGIHVTPP
jgi:hypothetical protein